MAELTTFHSDTTTVDLIDVLYDCVVGPRHGDILLIEDRDDVREGIAQLLALHGFSVIEASTGEQALSLLLGDPCGIALVLLDLLLPGEISGREFRAEQLRDLQLASIPTIVVSSCEPNGAGCAELRATAWLEKPFHFDALLTLVERYVSADQGAMVIDE